MSNIKSSFSIKDLENLSGVKAHTIRIWEKRYDLLKPVRSNTNIRAYDIQSLQRLLNVTLLLSKGNKISKIAELSESEIKQQVTSIALQGYDLDLSLNSFKIAMLNFDQPMFDRIYAQLLTDKSFQEIFQSTFMRLLNDIGLLWQSDTITPAHEHFISNLIKQKILINIERLQIANTDYKGTFVLFLPVGEIHELGLLYVHFELLLNGYRSIYLGNDVPYENLIDVQENFSNVTYVSYFTVSPALEKVGEYLKEIDRKILSRRDEKLLVLGRNTSSLNKQEIPKHIVRYESIAEFVLDL